MKHRTKLSKQQQLKVRRDRFSGDELSTIEVDGKPIFDDGSGRARKKSAKRRKS